jgi:hypothetical protein
MDEILLTASTTTYYRYDTYTSKYSVVSNTKTYLRLTTVGTSTYSTVNPDSCAVIHSSCLVKTTESNYLARSY